MGGGSSANGHVGAEVNHGGESKQAADDEVAVGIAAHAEIERHGGAWGELFGAFFEQKGASARVGPSGRVRVCGGGKSDEGESNEGCDEVCFGSHGRGVPRFCGGGIPGRHDLLDKLNAGAPKRRPKASMPRATRRPFFAIRAKRSDALRNPWRRERHTRRRRSQSERR